MPDELLALKSAVLGASCGLHTPDIAFGGELDAEAWKVGRVLEGRLLGFKNGHVLDECCEFLMMDCVFLLTRKFSKGD